MYIYVYVYRILLDKIKYNLIKEFFVVGFIKIVFIFYDFEWWLYGNISVVEFSVVFVDE